MRRRALSALILTFAVGAAARSLASDGVIHLGRQADPAPVQEAPLDRSEGLRRGFDYGAFRARLETLWFQRKLSLAQGRVEDAARQAELLRAFCDEEGITRLEGVADALLVEAERSAGQGSYRAALDALDLAEGFDPERAEVHFARAEVLWDSGQGIASAAKELLDGAIATVRRAVRDLTLFNALGIWAVFGVGFATAAFALLVITRHQAALRHEIAEWAGAHGRRSLGAVAGWVAVFAPLASWVAAGWTVPYWIAITYRYMSRSERLAALVALGMLATVVPGFGAGVGLYGLTTDPEIRATVDASGGPYTPERVVVLQSLVEARPDQAIYRFLLAGLYQSGRYFEDAFAAYKSALASDPSLQEAWINIGNMYHVTGQYTEAVANYQRALDVGGGSALALYNMHLSQAESFRFKEAKDSLARARSIDADAVDDWMTSDSSESNRAAVVDARIELRDIWSATMEGREVGDAASAGSSIDWFSGYGIVAILAALAALASTALGSPRRPAQRCARCGRAFCSYCRVSRDPHPYCSQCLHLFVIGEGLAPETKQLKLYEVERFDRLRRRWHRTASVLIPGAGQVLGGRAVIGAILMTVWFASWGAAFPWTLAVVETAAGIDLRLASLRAGEVPAGSGTPAWTILGSMVLLTTWIAANVGVLVRREV